jgi:hypothetical protein
MARPNPLPCPGHASRGYERVADSFVESLSRGGDIGGSCALFVRGRLRVSVWLGHTTAPSSEPKPTTTTTTTTNEANRLPSSTNNTNHAINNNSNPNPNSSSTWKPNAWREDTLMNVYSVSKALTNIALAHLGD